MRNIKNHILKTMIYKNIVVTLIIKTEIVGYMTVFLYIIRGTPHSAELNR